MKTSYKVPDSVLKTIFAATNYRNGKRVSWYEVDLNVLHHFLFSTNNKFDALESSEPSNSSRVLFIDDQGFVFGFTQDDSIYGKLAFINDFTAFNNGLNLPEKEIVFHR